jgi:hypothetical protein
MLALKLDPDASTQPCKAAYRPIHLPKGDAHAPLCMQNVNREEAMDAVLCGEVPAAFHDEAMVLYYLNHEMIKFGAGKYIPRVGNCDTDRNPHENKPWGKGHSYQWGEADSDNKGGKACALDWTGMYG